MELGKLQEPTFEEIGDGFLVTMYRKKIDKKYEVLAKLCKINVVCEVKGMGKGKYKFI